MASMATDKREKLAAAIKGMTYGVEIEMTGITREHAANITSGIVGGSVRYDGGIYHAWSVKDANGRKWKFVSDSSIHAVNRSGSSSDCRGDFSCELNTPPLTLDDMDTLQTLVRAYRAAGAVTGARYGCGIHVHVGAKGHTYKTLINFVRLVYAQEDMLQKALGISSARIQSWCQPITQDRYGFETHFLDDLKKCKSMQDVEKAWYQNFSNGNVEWCRGNHYDESRYHLLNLHRYFATQGRPDNTIEIRAFDSTLHAGKVRTYVYLVLSMNAYALQASRVTCKKNPIMIAGNEKFAMRTWLNLLGWTGPEFMNPHAHMQKNLVGDSAYRFGKDGDQYGAPTPLF